MSEPIMVAKSRRTRFSVKAADRSAGLIIKVGGTGTIAAVCAVAIFLLWVVLELFRPAVVGEPLPIASTKGGPSLFLVGVDEYQVLTWRIDQEGRLTIARADDGEPIESRQLTTVGIRTASKGRDGRTFTLGLDDGAVLFGSVDFRTDYYEIDAVPTELRRLDRGQIATWTIAEDDRGVVERTALGQYRRQSAIIQVEDPLESSSSVAIQSVQSIEGADGPIVVAVNEGGEAFLHTGEKELNPFSGEESVEWYPGRKLTLEERSVKATLACVIDAGRFLVVVYEDGVAQRYRIQGADLRIVETRDLVEGSGAKITLVETLLGDATLVVGDDRGKLGAWFTAPSPTAEDRLHLVCGHRIDIPDGGVPRVMGTSNRQRLFTIGMEGGSIHTWFMTSEKHLASVDMPTGGTAQAVAIAPKDDGLFAANASSLCAWSFDARHPETSFASLFSPIWYEHYESPTYVWQSSSGSDDYEPKMSLIPLIFGTLKATLYSMLFGVPLAILAAIYTSEFLHRRIRAPLKSSIEFMASLPSVVLGFMAALVLAPLAEAALPIIGSALFLMPVIVLAGAFVWQMIPNNNIREHRLVPIFVMGALALLASRAIAPVVEAWVFDGDVRAWLNGSIGEGTFAWFVILLPFMVLLFFGVVALKINPILVRRLDKTTRLRATQVHMLKFGVATVSCFALTWLLAMVGTSLHDIREGIPAGSLDLSPMTGFDPRNSLVVGFIMGFAIIPIIYTIAEDALSSVPEHLRAASLGAGATQWQTAIRIVVPTALSGLFSAVMIGLGRAVGETMIVLMAVGNTPILSLNIFNGFRTLSANIATELPEAVPNSTHYRTLFLAALVLFAMTFVINTTAEIVRLRFRRKALEL